MLRVTFMAEALQRSVDNQVVENIFVVVFFVYGSVVFFEELEGFFIGFVEEFISWTD